MILALDVGNTITVLGCIENGTILETVPVRTEADATAAEAAGPLLCAMLSRIGWTAT